jgi:phospholipase C
MPLDRRDFLKKTALATGAFAGWPRRRSAASPPPFGIDMTAAVGPVDHVIVLMMENRSFDHYFGWVTDTKDQVFVDHPDDPSHPNHGNLVATHRLVPGDYRGCGHPDPSHSWSGGRLQLAQGFLTGRNDEFAVGYYDEGDLDFYTALAREFTLCDDYYCSVMGPTFPNREYMHSAQSGGLKDNRLPNEVPGMETGFTWPTIWDLCTVNDVPWGYYFVDLPAIGLWGRKHAHGAHHVEHFFADLASGALPNVTFLDPGFTTGLRTDEHPYSDVRAGQAFVHNVVKSVVESPLWPRTALFINYDEWGGFYDHMLPPRASDVRATHQDPAGANDFGQLGFRVPCTLVSPYARRGALASEVVGDPAVFFEHCSILRTIERIFLRDRHLTTRDALAHDIGAHLLDLAQAPRLDAAQIVDALPRSLVQSCPCDDEALEGTFVGTPVEHGAGDGFEQLAEVVEDLSGIPIGQPELSEICGELPLPPPTLPVP